MGRLRAHSDDIRFQMTPDLPKFVEYKLTSEPYCVYLPLLFLLVRSYGSQDAAEQNEKETEPKATRNQSRSPRIPRDGQRATVVVQRMVGYMHRAVSVEMAIDDSSVAVMVPGSSYRRGEKSILRYQPMNRALRHHELVHIRSLEDKDPTRLYIEHGPTET